MKRSTRRVVTAVAVLALLALGAVLWRFARKQKKREEEAKAEREQARLASMGPPTSKPPAATSDALTETSPPLYIGDEVEALARVMASESNDREAQHHIGWVARNRAAQRADRSIARMVCQPCGKQVGNKRPFSSARPATAYTRTLADLILRATPSADPTQGATHILEAGLQNRLHAAGKTGFSAKMVRQRRLAHLDYYGSLGNWDYFGPKGGAGKQPVPAAWGIEVPPTSAAVA